MANFLKLPTIFCLLLLATTQATSARLLDEVVATPVPLPAVAPDAFDPVVPPEADDPNVVAPAVTPTATLPSGQIPVTNAAPIVPTEPLAPEPVTTPVTTPLTGGAATTTPATTNPTTTPATTPLTSGAATTATTPPITTPTTNPVTTPTGGGTAAAVGGEPALSFFMHDILGGSNPSGRVVTGIVANSDANNLPFSKPNDQIFPINGGIPLNTINGVINNNNYPSLVGLNGSPTNTLIQNNGNNVVSGNNNQPFVTSGQLPQGLTLNQLMFGSVTVVDNEITEGHELGSAVLGKAQGFYMVSSSDGSSHTLALTVLFHGGEHHEIEDTISFFGIHRTATPISHIAIVGGTGKYENAGGYATIETLPHEDQHTTDGLQTITHFTLYLTP